VAAGVLWLLGGFVTAAVFAHRGPLIHVLVGYPIGRLRNRVQQVTVGLGYVDALLYPVGRSEIATLLLAVLVVAVTAHGYHSSRGGERRARLTPTVVAMTVLGVLAAGAAARLAGWHVDHVVLVIYELALIAASFALFVDARWGRWNRAAITTLAIDLGQASPGVSLRDQIAGALGDPTLALGYLTADGDHPIDEVGRPLKIDSDAPGRVVTTIVEAGRPVAVLAHDAAVLNDPVLLDSVTALTKIALANVRLQAEAEERVVEVEASRRRLVTVADAERDRLEAELQTRVQRRLERVAWLLADVPGSAGLATQVAMSRHAISEFARGLHPRLLTESGLAAAIAELAAAAPVPVAVSVADGQVGRDAETAAYFVCAEALTNIAKYAHAAKAQISVRHESGVLVVEIGDDGVGGADPVRGSGLIGLSDRLDIVGGTITVDSPTGGGTRLTARIPRVSR
jgi:signal transduction histidine kinase